MARTVPCGYLDDDKLIPCGMAANFFFQITPKFQLKSLKSKKFS